MGACAAGLYARVPLLARAQDQRQRACKALAAARASGTEGSQKVMTPEGRLVLYAEAALVWHMQGNLRFHHCSNCVLPG